MAELNAALCLDKSEQMKIIHSFEWIRSQFIKRVTTELKKYKLIKKNSTHYIFVRDIYKVHVIALVYI